jgi:alkyl hydroperoxide reductase subunit F
LAKKLENHVKYYASETFEVKEFQEVKSVEKVENGGGEAAAQKDLFKITTLFGEEFLTESVLIATGGKRRKLPVPGADKFEHKGVTYCASCDGPVFTGKDVVVIGGGNSAFESASQLMAYCKSVTILNRGEEFRAEPTMVETVLKNENVKAINNANITEVLGDDFVTGIKYTENGEEKELNLSGVFVEIGSVPATDFIQEGLVEKNDYNQIIVNHLTMETSQKGI